MESTSPSDYFFHLFPILSYVVKDYGSALIKAHGNKTRLKFLQDCYDEQVVPASILPNRLLELTEHPFEEFHKNILTKVIELKKDENRKDFQIMKEKRQHFECSIPSEWKEMLRDHCYQEM